MLLSKNQNGFHSRQNQTRNLLVGFQQIFAQCEECLLKIYHVYNLIVCRMTQKQCAAFLLVYSKNFFAFTTKTFGSLSLWSLLCCKTNRKSNWQLSWEMKGTNLFFFFLKKKYKEQTCIQMRAEPPRNNCFLGELPGRTYLLFFVE